MKKFLFVIALLMAPWVNAGLSSDSVLISSWLQLIDNNEHLLSWQSTTPYFRSQVSLYEWSDALSEYRRQYGAFVSRSLVSTKPFTKVDGAEAGQYERFVYQTLFSRGQRVTEVVVFIKDGQQWKPVGYFMES